MFLAVLGYFLFAAFVIYVRRYPFPGFAGFINLGGITLVYALNAFVVYMMLYGRNKNRAEYFFDHLRAGRFHGLRRAAAQARGG